MKFKKIISVISAAVIAASAISVSAMPVSAADDADGWKAAYSKYLKNNIKEMDFSSVSPEAFGFSVIDLDGNGIPELIESGHMMHSATCIIYTYKGGKMLRLGETESCDYGTLYYDPVSRTISAEYEGQFNEITQYKVKNGKLKKLRCYGASYEKDLCKINEKEVTEKQYDEYFSKYALKYRIPIGRNFSFRTSDVDCAINGGKNYKGVYKKFLKGRIDQYGENSFSLKDITGDKIPELFLKKESGYGEVIFNVYTYNDGRLQFMGNSDLYENMGYINLKASYCKASDTVAFMSTNSDMGSSTKMFCSLKEGFLAQEAFLEKYYDGEANHYKYFNTNITKSKYNSKLKNYSKMKFKSVGKSYKLTESNINAVLK